ncbi:MAG: phosphotransferase [Candidatus Komeilibacteria bacterium]
MILDFGHSLTDVPRLREGDFLQAVVTQICQQCYSITAPVKVEYFHIYKYRYHKPESFSAVIGCKVTWVSNSVNHRLKLFVGAASNDSKLRAYHNLNWLRAHGFDQGTLQVIKPIVYLTDLKALVYEASEGQTLYWHLKRRPAPEQLLWPLHLSAEWLKKLHSITATDLPPTMSENNDQGIIKSLRRAQEKYGQLQPEQGEKFTAVLEKIHSFLPTTNTSGSLIYGDYHPENIIFHDLESRHLTMIDLSDVTLGSPYRDVGTFVQQFDFMSQSFLVREDINRLKRYFIEQYTGLPFDSIPAKEINLINLYQALTAVRSSVWLFEPESRRVSLELLDDARLLIEKVAQNQHSINLR